MLAASPAPAALIAQWGLEEGSGSTTTEAVTTTTSAAFGTGVTWSTGTPGPASTGALSFAGTGAVNTMLSAPTIAINGTGAKTITAWIKTPTVTGTEDPIIGYSPTNGGTAGGDLRLLVNTAGQLRFEANVGNFALSTATVADNAWHMVALVIPATTTTAGVSFYVDGTLAGPASSGGTATLNAATGVNPANNLGIVIGTDGNAGRMFGGLIDDVRIYDTALTKAELDTIRDAMAIPETSAALLGAVGLLALLRRRR